MMFGDWHRLNRNADKGSMTRDRDEILSTGAMYFNMGDCSDCIPTKDRRFDSQTIDFTLIDPRRLSCMGTVAVEDRVAFEEPIIGQCIGAVRGNHEYEYYRQNDQDVAVEAMTKMGRLDCYDPEGVITTIIFTDKNQHTSHVSIFVAHGKATSLYKSSLLNKYLIKLRHWNDVDILARGHCHYAGASGEVRVGLNGSYQKMNQRNVYAALTGGYLKTYLEDGQCYAAREDLDPIDIGMQRFTLFPSRNGMRIEAQI